jgi:hypothetical protein
MRGEAIEQVAVRGDPADHQQPASTAAWRTLRAASRACCCPARPVVMVIMPAAPGRDHPTDLLLCAHHYRVSCVALMAADAAVFDAAGRAVIPPARILLGAW